MNEKIENSDRWMLSVEDAIRLSGCTRTHLFSAFAAGRIQTRKAGRRTLIEASSLRAYLTALPSGRHGKTRKAA